MKCPGQDLGRKNPADAAYDIPCYNCNKPVEFFFDDLSRKCPYCGVRIEKDDAQLLKDYGCAAWCKEAEKCLGAERYARFKEISKNKEAKKEGSNLTAFEASFLQREKGGLEDCVKKD